MSRSQTLWIAVVVLIIASLACSAGQVTPTPTTAPTAAPLKATSTSAPTPKPVATSTSVPTPRPTAQPSLPAGVLFNDDFSSQQASEDKGWSFEPGDNVEWSWSANKLAISVQKKQWFGWNTPDGTYDDMGAEVEAQATSTGFARYGIIFRVSGEEDTQGFYRFGVTTDGKYFVDKKVDGQWADTDPVAATASQYVKQSTAKNTLGVLAQGNQISLYVNDFLVKTITDDSMDQGKAGVFAGTGDNDSAQVTFSRFTILTSDKAKADWGATPAAGGTQPTATVASGGGGGSGITVRNTFPGACQVNLWGKKEAVIRAEGNSSKSLSLPPGTYGAHVAVDIGERDLVQFNLPAGVWCVITCNAATKSVYNSCR